MDSTFKPALQIMAGRVMAFAGTFFIPLVLVRVFEPAEFGTYKQLFLIFSTLYLIAQIGMAESLYYFIPRKPEHAGGYVTNAVLVLAVAGAVSGVALYTLNEPIAALLNNPALAAYVHWIGAILAFTLVASGFEIVMISRKRIRWAALSYGVSDLVRAGLLILPALLARDLEWMLIGGTIFAFLRLLAMLAYLYAEFGDRLRPRSVLGKEQFAYALPFGLAALMEIAQLNYHQYAVSHYFDAATFAIYAVGCLQIPLVDFIAGPTSNVMMVRMAEQIRDGRRRALLDVWHDATRKLALMFLPLTALIIVAAPEIIVFLFTDKYAAAVPVFMVWSLMIVPAVFQTDGVLRVFAETRFLFKLNLLRLALIVLLIGWFMSAFALVGAAAITVIALALYRAAGLVRVRSLLEVGWPDILPWRDLVMTGTATLIAAAPVILVRAEVELPLFLLLMLEGIVFTATYSLAALALGLLRPEEKTAIAGWLGRWRPADAESEV